MCVFLLYTLLTAAAAMMNSAHFGVRCEGIKRTFAGTFEASVRLAVQQ